MALRLQKFFLMVARTSILALAICPLVVAGRGSQQPTFHAQVLPILQQHCQQCHRTGEAAPMSLLTYEETRPWAAAIREAVLMRTMPPWFADPQHGRFSNDRRLSEEEVDVLSSWVESGAREGDPARSTGPVNFAVGWKMGKPDVVFDMGYDFEVPAKGDVPYTYFVVPTGFAEDKWVESVEIQPGSRAVVHHAVVRTRPPGSGKYEHFEPGKPFTLETEDLPLLVRLRYTLRSLIDRGFRLLEVGREQSNAAGRFEGLTNEAKIISVYVPGGMPSSSRPGHARLIKAGSDLLFQMHYAPIGTQVVDRSRVALRFVKQPPEKRIINAWILNQEFAIPPGASNYRVEGRVRTAEDIELLSLLPHMHVRGKAFEYKAILPSGESKTLLRVPHYDFNWQLTYRLAEPLRLPKGTELIATGWYDNSPNNPLNPDPSATVRWGDQTTDEMLTGIMDFAIPADLDPAKISE